MPGAKSKGAPCRFCINASLVIVRNGSSGASARSASRRTPLVCVTRSISRMALPSLVGIGSFEPSRACSRSVSFTAPQNILDRESAAIVLCRFSQGMAQNIADIGAVALPLEDFATTRSALRSHELSAAEGRCLDPEFIRELFTPFRPVTVRPMFGGAGIFCEGLMFALVFDGAIYLKVDEASIPDFEREGSRPFVYTRAKVPAASAAPRSRIGACRSGFTTIPTNSRCGPPVRSRSPSARNFRRAGEQSETDRPSTAADRVRFCA